MKSSLTSSADLVDSCTEFRKQFKCSFLCVIKSYIYIKKKNCLLSVSSNALFSFLRLLINNFTEIHTILGHPKTKAFITHGGTNGIYEAIYHGVPMVGLPLFAEQPDNINRVKAKGAAVRLDLETMSKTDFLNALKQVINNPS